MTAAGRARRGASWLLIAAGTILVLLAVLSAAGSLVALADRARFGRGIMFADVELLAMLAVVCAVPGVAALWAGSRLAGR